ncbi:MAG: glycosyltransferase family 39 protein [Candidatus Moranbacteria bacterium]|nr:glycosyltransferase family 39 protein [Candidatus Moranbacteria bacterium]
MEFLKKRAALLVTLILSFHFILSLVVSTQESMTFDEKAHIPAAYSYVRYADMRINPEHPPLLKDLSGLFLLPLGLDFPLTSKEWQTGANEQWVLGDMFINCSRPELACNDADTILLFSRIPIIIIAVILGIFIFRWTRELGGTIAGLIAVTLYAFDPNIIAHNHYVTTDIGSAAFIFFSFYFFVRFLKHPSAKTILLSGLFLGLAELTKFSAVLLFPIFGLFTLLYALIEQQPKTDSRTLWRFKLRNVWRYLLGYSGSVVVCFILIWVLYAANTWAMPGEKLAELAQNFLNQKNVFAETAQGIVVTMSQSPILKPMGEYLLGVFMVFSRVAGGNTHYFLGTVTDISSPWYFPVVFLLKETLPFLLLLLFTTGYSLYRIARLFLMEKSQGIGRFLAHSFQSRIAQYLSVFFILFYSYVSITGNLNIGFRHLFPILPFLYMLIGKTLANFYKRHADEPATHQLISIIIGITMLIVVAIPILSYPSYLSYFNAAAGGHTQGYRYVTDSNYDWGQDLKHLKKWVEHYNACVSEDWMAINNGRGCQNPPKTIPTQTPIDKIRVDYFGGSNPKYYLGDKHISWWASREPEVGWYAISSFFYQESLYKKLAPGEQNYAWLKAYTPLDRAGDSFFIYYISEADLAK